MLLLSLPYKGGNRGTESLRLRGIPVVSLHVLWLSSFLLFTSNNNPNWRRIDLNRLILQCIIFFSVCRVCVCVCVCVVSVYFLGKFLSKRLQFGLELACSSRGNNQISGGLMNGNTCYFLALSLREKPALRVYLLICERSQLASHLWLSFSFSFFPGQYMVLWFPKLLKGPQKTTIINLDLPLQWNKPWPSFTVRRHSGLIETQWFYLPMGLKL